MQTSTVPWHIRVANRSTSVHCHIQEHQQMHIHTGTGTNSKINKQDSYWRIYFRLLFVLSELFCLHALSALPLVHFRTSFTWPASRCSNFTHSTNSITIFLTQQHDNQEMWGPIWNIYITICCCVYLTSWE